MTRKTPIYNNLLKLIKENIKNNNEGFFTMEQNDFLKRIGVEGNKYNVDGKFKFSIFKRACLTPNLMKIKKEENITVLLTKSFTKDKMTLFFNIARLLQDEEEKHSKESQKQNDLYFEEPKTQENEISEESEDNENIPTPFFWLTTQNARKLLYGLFKICPADSKYFYERIRSLIKNQDEEIAPILDGLKNLNEEYRVLTTNINDEEKVAIFVLEDTEEVHKFNIQIEEYEDLLCNKIIPGEKYSILATNEEGLKYYTLLIKKMRTRVKWAKEDTFAELKKILDNQKTH